MTITFSVPPYLQGQRAENQFDPGLAGLARGAGPTGPLGATLTLPSQYQRQAYDLGLTFSSWTPG